MTEVELRVERSVSALGPEWDRLFAAGAGLQTTREWWTASAEAALPPGAEPEFLAITAADGPLALFPMLAGPGRVWRSLTTPYTCIYQPLIRLEAAPGLLRAATLAFGRSAKRRPITLLEALDPAWPGLTMLRDGLAQAGLPSRTFEHFGNWHEPVPLGSWPEYLKSRPGALRETIRRKTRAIERDDGLRIEIARAGPRLAAALEAYEIVYARSWKEPEPYPRFNAALVRALAPTGTLRIAVMWSGERPIAAQYWSVMGQNATVLKLAHDEDYKALSPGTVLTAAAIRDLIETDAVADLDFGRGDDPYKRAWAAHRRRRVGLFAADPTSAAGLRQLLRHDAGRAVRRVRRFFRDA